MSAPRLERVQVPVAGMTCQACASSVEKALRSVPGIERAEVDLGSRTATLFRDPELATGHAIATAVSRAGYSVPEESFSGERSIEADVAFAERAAEQEASRTRRNVVIAAIFGTPALLAHALGWPHEVALLLSIPVQFVAGWDILSTGTRALLRLAPDMNSLVALGSLAAWIASAIAFFAPDALPGGENHLHAALLIVFFVLLGRWLEGRARARAGDALRLLLELVPPTARVLRRGEELEVPLAEVRLGNLVLVRPGERIPVDGAVIDGRTSVDAALLTGESAPVERGPGDKVHAGTINGLGAITLRATGIGASSALGRITAAVRDAQGSRAPVQRLADKISARFVPIVLAIAAVACGAWLAAGANSSVAISHAIAVLVAACPCALGLATPAAVLVATGRGAREGILVRHAEAFERLAEVDTLLLDKTGTLTRGKPEFVSVRVAEERGPGEDHWLAVAAAVERSSEQPLGRALVIAALARNLEVPAASGFRAEPGRGAEARVNGSTLFVGSPQAARERTNAPAEVDRLIAPLVARGETPVVLCEDGRMRAAFGLFDAPRPSAASAVRKLRSLGLELYLFSGDHQAAVDRVGEELGLDRVRGGMLPQDKVAAIGELQAGGHSVAMAGDGINDAPALAAADVGIAMGGGADVALEAADCALLRDDPERLAALVVLARRTLHTIRANLLWAFGYNLLALPLAAGVIEPWTGWSVPSALAAAAMAGSSVLVVANSLRLRRVSLEVTEELT